MAGGTRETVGETDASGDVDAGRDAGRDADTGRDAVGNTGTVGADGVEQSPAGVDLFVPSLLAGLDADDEGTRESAGCALCLLARTQPAAVTEIVGTLVERLVASPERGPVLRTLAVLVGDHDREIRSALVDAVDRDDAKVLYRHIRTADGWDLEAVLADEESPSGDGSRADPDRVTETRDADQRADDDTGTGHVEVDTGEVAGDEGDPAAGAARADSRSRSVRLRHARIQQVVNSDAFAAISRESRFEQLQVVEPKSERRYGELIRTHAADEDDEYGVAIRLCPEADTDGYGSALAARFRNWRQVHSKGVVSAVDWGTSPRPWVATEYVERTLADRGELPPAAILAHAHTLTAGLAELHQYDVVHGGIDPGNVVYATDVLGDQDQPMLDNVGLMTVFRQCFDPASYLDPRYAAPEYFDSQYGSLDHATDVYQLGMVLYRVCTGRPPFEGSFEEVRRQVLKDRPPAPSSVNDALPTAIDEIVAKATAKQKLTRYETASQFYRDVDRLCEAAME